MKYLIALFFISLLAGPGIALEPFGGVKIYAHDIVLFVLLLAHARHRPKHIPPLAGRIIGFAAVCVLSLAVNALLLPRRAIGTGLLYLVRFLSYASLYWVVSEDQKNKRYWLFLLYGFGVALAVLGLVQIVLYPDLRNLYYLGWDPHFQRLFSSLLDPNFTGILLVLALMIGFSFKEKNQLWFLFQAALFYSLGLTFSRSSILSLIAASVTLTILKAKKRQPALLGIVLVLFVMEIFSNSGEGRSLLRTASVYARLANWQSASQLMLAKPVLGWGFNTLSYIRPPGPRTDGVQNIPSHSSAGVDNSFLFVGATTGFLGLFAYLWLLWGIWQTGRGNTLLRSSMVAMLVHAQFVNSLFYPWVMVWLWVLSAAVERATSDS